MAKYNVLYYNIHIVYKLIVSIKVPNFSKLPSSWTRTRNNLSWSLLYISFIHLVLTDEIGTMFFSPQVYAACFMPLHETFPRYCTCACKQPRCMGCMGYFRPRLREVKESRGSCLVYWRVIKKIMATQQRDPKPFNTEGSTWRVKMTLLFSGGRRPRSCIFKLWCPLNNGFCSFTPPPRGLLLTWIITRASHLHWLQLPVVVQQGRLSGPSDKIDTSVKENHTSLLLRLS